MTERMEVRHESTKARAHPAGQFALTHFPEVEAMMIVTHVSYGYLLFTAAVHALTAGGVAFGVFNEPRRQWFAFGIGYSILAAISFLLYARNGRWGVDEKYIYRGWRLKPLIRIGEIEHAQIGMPRNWISVMASFSGPLGLVEQAQRSALLLRLTGNRWFIWCFFGMANRDEFVDAVMDFSPEDEQIEFPPEVLRCLSVRKTGTIIRV
jgi:hypothetical protein